MAAKKAQTPKEEKVAKGNDAKNLLTNPLFQECFQALEARFTSTWQTSQPGDSEKREAAYHQLNALNMIKAEFESMITSGKLAQNQN